MLQLLRRLAGLAPARAAAAVALCCAPAAAQLAASHAPAPTPDDLLARMNVAAATLQELEVPAAPGETFTVQVTLGERVEQLVLWPHSLRSPGYRLLVQGADGETVERRPGPPATYRGIALGRPGSVVAGSLHGGRLEALVRLAPGADVWSIQPASQFDGAAPRTRHVVASSEDDVPMDVTCGTGDLHFAPHPGNAPNLPQGTEPLLKVCEIACDADTQYYAANGSSVANTEADIENVLNGVEAIYEADVAITYEITAILVRTSEPDPYSTTNAGDMLGELQAQWTQNHATIPRDVAHLFTGKNIAGSTIGIAWLSGICSNAFGYGLSQSKYTGNFTNRVGLTAHELGHNWSAPHCNGAASGCKIMCSAIGACGPVTSFAPASINKITNYASISGCLDETGGEPPMPPNVTAVVPPQVPAVAVGNQAHVSLTGTDLDTVSDVLVDGISLGDLFPSGFTVASESQIDMRFPLLDQLGDVDITVLGVAGNDTATVEIVANSPPAVELGSGGDPEVLLSILPVTLTVGGQPGNAVLVWASFTMAPSSIPGTLDLAIGNGFLDLHLVALPVVDAKGWTQYTVNGVKLPASTTVLFQGVEYDPVTGALPVESTNVAAGLWLL